MTEDRRPRGILNIEQEISKLEVEIALRGFASLAITIL